MTLLDLLVNWFTRSSDEEQKEEAQPESPNPMEDRRQYKAQYITYLKEELQIMQSI